MSRVTCRGETGQWKKTIELIYWEGDIYFYANIADSRLNMPKGQCSEKIIFYNIFINTVFKEHCIQNLCSITQF